MTADTYTVEITRNSRYQDWATNAGLTGADSNPTADRDGDGLPNVLLNGPAQVTDTIAAALFQPADGLFYGRVQVPLQSRVPSYSCAPDLDNWTENNIQQLLLAGQAAGGASLVADTVRQFAGRVQAPVRGKSVS